MLYNKLPISGNSTQYSEALRLKKEVVRLKREMGTVSAQDEFARWAKLRRQHDKAVADYDKACMCSVSSSLLELPLTCLIRSWRTPVFPQLLRRHRNGYPLHCHATASLPPAILLLTYTDVLAAGRMGTRICRVVA